MMRKFILILLVLTAFDLTAQITKNVGDFNEVKVFDRISVELVPSTNNKVEITGNRSEDVEVINNNGDLKLRMKLEKLLKGEEVQVKVFFTELKAVEASQGSYISCGETLKVKSMEITAKEGSEIKLDLDAARAEVRSVTGGIIKLTGTAILMDANLGTGGILEARNFVTEKTDVSINAGGEAYVNATDLVDADVKAGGTVTIYGKPKKIEKETTLGGTIRESD